MSNTALVLALGALILLYQAWREYSNSGTVEQLKLSNQPVRKELEKVRMSALTTNSEYERGRYFYIFFFLLLYIVLLNFPEMARFLLSGQTSVEGGADVGVNLYFGSDNSESPDGTLANDPVLPVSLALAMMIGVSSPTFAIIERMIRSVSYTIAGVPRNIYKVIRNLEELPYADFTEGESLPVYDAFVDFLARQGDNFRDHSNTKKHISSALQIIDLLQGPIIGPQRIVFQNLFSGDEPLEEFNGLRARYNQLRNDINDLEEAEDKVERLDKILTEATDLAGAMQSLFALFAIRSKQRSEDSQTTQERIIAHVTKTGAMQSINDIALAAVFGALFGGLLMVLFAQFVTAPEGVDANAINLTYDAVRNLVVPLLPSVVLASFLSIYLRHVRFDQDNWPNAEINAIPFSHYARLILVPALFATLSYGIISALMAEGVMELVFRGALADARAAGIEYLLQEWRQLPRLLFMFFFFGCGLLFIADQHQNLPWKVTVGAVATVLSVILYIVAILCQFLFQLPAPQGGVLTSNSISLLMIMPFVMTLYLYASAAEFSETGGGSGGGFLANLMTRNREA